MATNTFSSLSTFVARVAACLVIALFLLGPFSAEASQHHTPRHTKGAGFRPRTKRAATPIIARAGNGTTVAGVNAAMMSALTPSSNLNLFTTTVTSLSSTPVTVLTNETHALYSMSLSSSLTQSNPSAFGYIALGMGGSTMSSAKQMVIAYPDSAQSNSGGWAVSSRKAGGHAQPKALDASQVPPPMVVSSLSAAPRTLAFVLPLDRKTNPSQSLIYAYSSHPVSIPASGNADDAQISQHDDGMFGSLNADLSKSANAGGTGGGQSTWTKYDVIIVVHAICGALAWVVIAPVAVLIARLGRKLHGTWFKLHSLFQFLLTLILTAAAVILAIIAISTKGGGFTVGGHQLLGFVILALIVIQVCMGQYIHAKFEANRTKRPGRNVSHIVLGITLLVLGYVQTYLGLRLYQKQRPENVASYLFTLFWIFAIAPFVLYGISLALLAHERRNKGLSWNMAAFGLGREGGESAMGNRRGISSADVKGFDSIEKDIESGMIVVPRSVSPSETVKTGTTGKFSLFNLFKGNKESGGTGGKVSPFTNFGKSTPDSQATSLRKEHESWGNGLIVKDELDAFQRGQLGSNNRISTPIANAFLNRVKGRPGSQQQQQQQVQGNEGSGLRNLLLKPQLTADPRRDNEAYINGERSMPAPARQQSQSSRPGAYQTEEDYRQMQRAQFIPSQLAYFQPQQAGAGMQRQPSRRDIPGATLNHSNSQTGSHGRASPAAQSVSSSGKSRYHNHGGSNAGSLGGKSDTSSSSHGSTRSRQPLVPAHNSYYARHAQDAIHRQAQQQQQRYQQEYQPQAPAQPQDVNMVMRQQRQQHDAQQRYAAQVQQQHLRNAGWGDVGAAR